MHACIRPAKRIERASVRRIIICKRSVQLLILCKRFVQLDSELLAHHIQVLLFVIEPEGI